MDRGPRIRSPGRLAGRIVAKRIIWIVVALIAIPLVAYGLFLAAVMVVLLTNEPIRWN